MLDSLTRHFALLPLLLPLEEDVVLSYYVSETDRRHLLRLRADGSQIWDRQYAISDVVYGLESAGGLLLVGYRTLIDESRQHYVTVHRFDTAGDSLGSDTIFFETLPDASGFVGTAFAARDGALLAALVTLRGSQAVDSFLVRLVRYRAGETTVVPEWNPGPFAEGTLLYAPAVVLTETGGVFGCQARWSGGAELRCRAFDAQGRPGTAVHTIPLAPHQAVNGLALREADGLIYAAYTAQPEFGFETLRGAYLTAFPLAVPSTVPAPAAPQPPQPAFSASPNPCNGSSRLAFELIAPGPATLVLYDVRGRQVAMLHDGPLAAGRHERLWTARDLPSGLYFARLATPQGVAVRKLCLIR